MYDSSPSAPFPPAHQGVRSTPQSEGTRLWVGFTAADTALPQALPARGDTHPPPLSLQHEDAVLQVTGTGHSPPRTSWEALPTACFGHGEKAAQRQDLGGGS